MEEDKKGVQRTVKQNRAIHQLFNMIAATLNENGLDMRRTLKEGVDIPWSGKAVKEYMWKPIQKAQLNKDSTAQLTTKEIDLVYDTLNKHLGEKLGVHIPFPSVEQILIEQEAKRRAGQ